MRFHHPVALMLASVAALLASFIHAGAGTLEDMIESGVLPAVARKPISVTVIDNVEENGRLTLVLFSVREPQTRTAIHMHDHAGVTCITEGEMTLYMEGMQPVRKTAGECYYMPSGERMIGFNSGHVTAKFHDFFNYPAGGMPLRVVGGAGCGTNSRQVGNFCDKSPYLSSH